MKKITSFEAACEAQGISAELPDVSTFPEDLRISIIAFYKLTVIAAAINDHWIADFTNNNQRKWFPVFWINKTAGVAARTSDYGFGVAGSAVVSRLCFETEEMSDFAAETFEEIWLQYLLGK